MARVGGLCDTQQKVRGQETWERHYPAYKGKTENCLLICLLGEDNVHTVHTALPP